MEAKHTSEIAEASHRIRELNDAFRKTLVGGQVMLTQGVNSLASDIRAAAILRVATFSDFDPCNDPDGEHDFGSFDLADQKFFWKIDYYAPDLRVGSDDPSDIAKTTRVLTLMLAEEY